jgi:hypothetical protein
MNENFKGHRVKALVLLVGVIFCVSCPEWSAMLHNQQSYLGLLVSVFPVSTLQRIKSLPEALNRRLLAIVSSSKIPTIETLRSFFPLHRVPVYLLAILTLTNCKIKESCLTPAAILRC